MASVAGCCLSLAGCDREEDIRIWKEASAKWFPVLGKSSKHRWVGPGGEVLPKNDAVGALAGTTGGVLTGIVCISPSGSLFVDTDLICVLAEKYIILLICGTGQIVVGFDDDSDTSMLPLLLW